MQLTSFAPNQHAAALVEDCRGVNRDLSRCSAANCSTERQLCCTSKGKNSSNRNEACYKARLFHWYQIFIMYLITCNTLTRLWKIDFSNNVYRWSEWSLSDDMRHQKQPQKPFTVNNGHENWGFNDFVPLEISWWKVIVFFLFQTKTTLICF